MKLVTPARPGAILGREHGGFPLARE